MSGEFVGYDEFLKRTAAADHAEFLSRGAAVVDSQEFLKMRDHVLSLYRGVVAAHSFVSEDGQYVDCIPVEQQPSVRGTGGTIAVPPSLLTGMQGRPAVKVASSLTLTVAPKKDAFGNERSCPPKTIPMRRVTLEELARFKRLADFLAKRPAVE